MKKHSLKRAIFTFIYTLVFALSIAFFIPSFIQQKRYIKTEFLERAKSLTRNLALNAQTALANNNRNGLYALTDSLMRETDILWIVILDDQQHILAENGTIGSSTIMKDVKDLPMNKKVAIKELTLPDGTKANDIYIGIKQLNQPASNLMVNDELALLQGMGQGMQTQNDNTTKSQATESDTFSGIVHVGMSLQRLQKAEREIGTQLLIICLLALLGSTVAGSYFARFLLTPINQFIERMQDIASRKGDLTQRLNLDRQDEFGEMASYFNQFMESLFLIVRETVNLVSTINASLEDISSTAEEISTNADGINLTVQGVTDDLEKQERASTETHDTIESVLTRLLEITEKSQDASQVSAETESVSRDGGKTVQEAVKIINSVSENMNLIEGRMQRLNQAVSGIGEFIDAIRNIASQTNLLALNAAIEAARAGEAGRGFSVVAEEVRKLAEDSSRASEKVQSLIDKIQVEVKGTNEATKQGITVVNEGASMVNKAGQSLTTIMQSAEHSALVTGDISTNLVAQSTSLQSMIKQVESVKTLVKSNFEAAQSVAASIEEQTASFEQISTAIQELSENAQSIRNLVVEFKIK